MTGRISLMVSLLAIGAAVAAIMILGDKIVVLNRRVAALEQRPVAAPAPPAIPPTAPPETESPEEVKRKEIRKKADEMFREHLDALGKKVEAGPELLAKLRSAFDEEFAFYADGVLRSLDDSDRGDDLWMESPEFRRGLEERVAETDQKLKGLLTVSQYWAFDEWRKELRKETYRLD
jgi:phosphopantothenate synthetase